MDLKLELTREEVSGILITLSRHPFESVASLIKKIDEQAMKQVEEAKKEA